MNIKLSTNHKLNRMLVNLLSIFAILAIAFPVTSAAYAESSSFFAGHWQATDMDGSDIRLTIGGPPHGPFQITWTESYISFCTGEAGIIRGIGQLNESDPYLLEADLQLQCFTTGATLDLHLVWRYHPTTNTLSSRYDDGVVTIWHRPGRPLLPPPALGLRVSYGDDWVESFYEAGHMAWVTVTESDGVTVKATAELVTEPKDFWVQETGFQTRMEDWVPAPPDIQPNDWVFGWIDNGASAQVQIGDIHGMINLAADSIEGTVNAPWFANEVEVECHSWGAPLPEEILKSDMVLPNGEDPYSCSWAGEWDIQPYQNAGVGYTGPDGHWVANTFFARDPRIIASEAGDWFWTTDFNSGTLNLFIYESASDGATLLWQGTLEADESGFANALPAVHGQDLLPGNYVVVSDGMNEKGLVLETITMEVFDTENEIMSGTAPLGREVSAAAGPQEWQERLMVQADPATGAWLADFKTIGFDITEDMRPWSFAQIFDEDGDANEASTPPALPSTWRDDFDTETLVPGWFWENGDSSEWGLNDEPGFLRLSVSNTSAGDGNLLLRQVQQHYFVIETHVIFEPHTNFQFAGLVIYQDDYNDLALGRAFCDVQGACVGNGIYFDYVVDGNWVDGNFGTVVNSPNDVYLRLERRGDVVTAFYSDEGSTWYEIGTHAIPSDFQVNGVGLMAVGDYDTSDPNISAYFDYFELTEG